MMENPVLFGVFIFLSVFAAITEGLSISLLIPILDSQSMSNSFSNIPVLGYVSRYFEDIHGNEKLILAASFLFIVVLFRGALQMAVLTLSIIVPIEVLRKTTMTGYKYLLYASMGYLNSHDIGEHLNNVKERPMRITDLLRTTADAISMIFVLIILVGMMLLVSWKMTLLSVLFLGALSLGLRYFSEERIAKLGRETSQAQGHFNQVLYESLEGMRIIRLKVAEQSSMRMFGKALEGILKIQRRREILYAIPGPALTTMIGVFICALLFFSTVLSESDSRDLTSQLILFLFLLTRLLSPITGLNTFRHRYVGNIAALEETDDFFRIIKNQIPKNGELHFEHLNSEIEFKNVSFYYEKKGTTKPVLQDLNIKIPKGKTVAIVGPSGSGKSTIINLLGRLYDPQDGQILIDGHNLRDFDVSTWRRRVSVISQDVVLFNDSIANNIAFGEDEILNDQIVSASKMASCHKFIEEMADGYNTIIGDRGVRLSGGQKQRIAIARAFLSEPDILIIDEGTSQLDSITEHQIQKAIEHLSQNCTVVTVAHRLSTVKNASKIIVMEDGKVIENGNHDELIALKNIYWNLINYQQLN